MTQLDDLGEPGALRVADALICRGLLVFHGGRDDDRDGALSGSEPIQRERVDTDRTAHEELVALPDEGSHVPLEQDLAAVGGGRRHGPRAGDGDLHGPPFSRASRVAHHSSLRTRLRPASIGSIGVQQPAQRGFHRWLRVPA